MIHQFTAIWVLIAPSNLFHDTTGGQACNRKSKSMSKDAQTVNGIKSICDRHVPHSNQSIRDQKHSHSRQLHWTLSLNSLNPKDTTPFLPLLTTIAPKPRSSFLAKRKSQRKEQPSYISNTCSTGLDYPHTSLVIETPGSTLSSPENYVNY